MEKSHIAARIVIVLNILFLGFLFVVGGSELFDFQSHCSPPIHRARQSAAILTTLLGISTGILCLWTKKNLQRMASFFLFVLLFFAVFRGLGKFLPFDMRDVEAVFTSLFIDCGISTIFLTYWIFTVFSKGSARLDRQASVFRIGFALVVFAFLLELLGLGHGPVSGLLIIACCIAGTFGANIAAMCLVDEGNEPSHSTEPSEPHAP